MLINLNIKSRFDLEQVDRILDTIKDDTYNSLMNYDKISNFDFVLSGASGNQCKYSVDTNTADINWINRLHLDKNIITKIESCYYDIQDRYPIHDIQPSQLYSGHCSVGIKFLKRQCRIYPHVHNVGENSPIIFGCLLNNLKASSILYTGSTKYVSSDVDYEASEGMVNISKKGDTFCFAGDYVHSFHAPEYTELLLVSLDKNILNDAH
jgi:hypothetical protein